MKIKSLLLSTWIAFSMFSTTLNAQQSIYTFDNGNANNDLGTGQNGVISGLHTFTGDRFGNPNRAIILGTTGFINLGLQPVLNGNSPHTIALWIKKPSTAATTILTKNANTSFGSTAMVSPFRVETDASKIYANRACNGSGAFINTSNTAYNTITTGTWYHYTYMYDGVDNLYTYIDGIFYASISGIGTAQCANAGGWGLIVGLHPNDPGRLGLGVSGAVDEIQIYNTTLSGVQILAIKNLPANYLPKIVTQPISSCTAPANLSVSATGENLSYAWSNGSTTSNIVANTAGAYTVTVSGYGTVISKTVVVGTFNPVIATQPTLSTNIKCRNPFISVSASGIDLNYAWSNGNTMAGFNTTLAGNYTVAVSSGTCATVTSTTFNANLMDCIADFVPVNGNISGFGGHFGQVEGYVAGSCGNQTISISAKTSNDASTGFNDSRTEILWRFTTNTGDFFNDYTDLPQFNNQRTITITSANLTVGGYYARIEVCGNGVCSFRNPYTSGVISLVANSPTLASIRVSKIVNGNGIDIDANPANANSNPFNICTVNGSRFEHPQIATTFTGFVANYSWSINGINLVKVSNTNQNMNTSTMFGHDAQTPNASIVRTNFGNYAVAASNYCGTAIATYTVAGLTPPFVSVLSSNINTCLGATITLPITVRGSNINSVSVMPTDLSVNRNLFGPYNNYVFTASGVRDVANNRLNTGNYLIRVSTQNCGNTDATFNVTANGVSIAAQAAPATVCSGLSHTFVPTISGSGSLLYSWRNATTNTITSTTGSSLTTTAAGVYTLTVSSGVCRAISSAVSLSVIGGDLNPYNVVADEILDCDNNISGGNVSAQFYISDNVPAGAVKKVFNGTTLLDTRIAAGGIENNYSNDMTPSTIIGSSFNPVTLTSTISNSCKTVSGKTTILIPVSTITSLTIPAQVEVTIGGNSPRINITGGTDIKTGIWEYNNAAITVVDLKSAIGSSKYTEAEFRNNFETFMPNLYVNNVSASDLTSDFVVKGKNCPNHPITTSNTMRLVTVGGGNTSTPGGNTSTPGGNTSTPGTNVSATVTGLQSNANLSNIINDVLVSITGSGFVNGASVTVGGVVLTNVVVSGNVITGTIPANSTIANPTNPTIIVQNPGAAASAPINVAPVVVNPTSTSLPAYQSTSFKISPNPLSNGELRIENGVGALVIYNAQGSVVYSSVLVSETTILNLNLIKGIYLVKVGNQTTKLVVE